MLLIILLLFFMFKCPENQLIKTNQTNILIRSLVLKKRKVDSNSKDGKAVSVTESSRKRYVLHFYFYLHCFVFSFEDLNQPGIEFTVRE